MVHEYVCASPHRNAPRFELLLLRMTIEQHSKPHVHGDESLLVFVSSGVVVIVFLVGELLVSIANYQLMFPRGGIDSVVFKYDVSYLGSAQAQLSRRYPDGTSSWHTVCDFLFVPGKIRS
jgi:hypothetical protein